jgi:hypothetical protein
MDVFYFKLKRETQSILFLPIAYKISGVIPIFDHPE